MVDKVDVGRANEYVRNDLVMKQTNNIINQSIVEEEHCFTTVAE